MENRSFVWIGIGLGSTLGSFIPALWGAGIFSLSSIIFSVIGAMVGVWIVFRLSQ